MATAALKPALAMAAPPSPPRLSSDWAPLFGRQPLSDPLDLAVCPTCHRRLRLPAFATHVASCRNSIADCAACAQQQLLTGAAAAAIGQDLCSSGSNSNRSEIAACADVGSPFESCPLCMAKAVDCAICGQFTPASSSDDDASLELSSAATSDAGETAPEPASHGAASGTALPCLTALGLWDYSHASAISMGLAGTDPVDRLDGTESVGTPESGVSSGSSSSSKKKQGAADTRSGRRRPPAKRSNRLSSLSSTMSSVTSPAPTAGATAHDDSDSEDSSADSGVDIVERGSGATTSAPASADKPIIGMLGHLARSMGLRLRDAPTDRP